MKKIIYSFMIALCTLPLLSCASTSTEDGTKKVLSRLENDFLSEPPKWIELVDIEDENQREKEIKEFFPELKDTLIFPVKTTNTNVDIAIINAENSALTEYQNRLEKPIYEGIKDKDIKNIIAFIEEKDNMKGTSLNEEELKIKIAKNFAIQASVNGLMTKKSFWLKYDFIDNQSGNVVRSSYDVYKIFYVEKSLFDKKVNQYISLLENENTKAVKSLEDLRKQRLEEERLRKEAEEKARLEEERLQKEAEEKALIEQKSLSDIKIDTDETTKETINNDFNIIETTSNIETNTPKEDTSSTFE